MKQQGFTLHQELTNVLLQLFLLREREEGSPLHMRQQDLIVHELRTDLGPGGRVAGRGSVRPDRIGHSGLGSPDSSGGPAPRCGGDCPGCGIPGERSPPVSGSV